MCPRCGLIGAATGADCSGDVYVGMETKPGAIPLQFSGHLTVEAVIKDLTVNHGLGSGSSPRLLLSGSSAGGIGTFVNADFVTSLLPTVDVKAAPQGGFFFPNVTAFPYWLDGDFVYPVRHPAGRPILLPRRRVWRVPLLVTRVVVCVSMGRRTTRRSSCLMPT